MVFGKDWITNNIGKFTVYRTEIHFSIKRSVRTALFNKIQKLLCRFINNNTFATLPIFLLIFTALDVAYYFATKPKQIKKNKQKEIMDNPDKYTIGTNEEITFVHLVQRAPGLSTFINLPTLNLNLTMAGELVTVSRVEADQIVGKYRSWFDNGTLAVYNDEISKRYAEIKKIKPASSYEISKCMVKFLQKSFYYT